MGMMTLRQALCIAGLAFAGPVMAQIGKVGNVTAKYLKDAREIEIWPLN